MKLLLTCLVGVEMETGLFGYLSKVTWGSGEPVQRIQVSHGLNLSFSKG